MGEGVNSDSGRSAETASVASRASSSGRGKVVMYAYVRARRISKIYHSPPIRSEAYWKPSVPMSLQSSAPAGTAAVAKNMCKAPQMCGFEPKLFQG